MKKWIFLVSAFLLTSTAYSKGKLQDSDFKSLSELTTAGGTSSQLLNDTKIYITASGINSQLSSAITNGLIGGGGGGSSGVNLIVNPGFETGIVQGYSSSGGTFAAISSGSNLLIGKGSATFQATATGQYMSSAAYAVPNGLKGTNCAVGALYSGGDANLVLQAYDGTNVLASTPLTPSTVPRPAYATFVCPSSGNIQERVVSSGSSALVALDQFFLGQNTISQVSQATLYGTIAIGGACAGNWTTSSTTYASMGTNTGCTYVTTGNASVPSTQIQGVKFASLPPGEYIFEFNGVFFTGGGGQIAQYRLSDGTNVSPETPATDSASTIAVPTLGLFHMSYSTAQSNVTFELQGQASVSGTALANANGEIIKVWRYPTQSELAVRPETINWLVDVSQVSASNADTSLGTSTVSSLSELSNSDLVTTPIGRSMNIQVPCSGGNASTGTTCISGAPDLGVVFNLPATQDVQACVQFTHNVNVGTSTSLYSNFLIVETPNTSLTPLQQSSVESSAFGTSSTGINYISQTPHTLCNVLHFTSAGQKTVRLLYAQTVSGSNTTSNVILTDGSSGQVRWTLKPITQNVPAPILVGSVISPSAGVQNIVTAEFDGGSGAVCSGSTCAVNYQNGNSISSVTRSGPGSYVISFFAGTFSAPPLCICNSTGGGGAAGLQSCIIPSAGYGGSNSSAGTIIADKTGTAADGIVNIQCIGNK
jgi:hypothetical protein